MIVCVKTQNGGTLNMRREASTSSAVLATIKNGTKLEVEKIDNTWSKTTFNGKTGYVMNKFLAEIDEAKTKEDLQKIYNSLKETLSLIEQALK